MNDDRFWELIEQARERASGDTEGAGERLTEVLGELSPDEVRGFEDRRCRLMERSYTSKLWGAAYLINGGCSDDGFDYFRGWLFLEGRAVFERALDNPDSLASLVSGDDLEAEGFLYAAMHAHEQLTGEPYHGEIHLEHREEEEDWDFDDDAEMRRRYPRIWAAVMGG